jgi:hypothetical protein
MTGRVNLVYIHLDSSRFKFVTASRHLCQHKGNMLFQQDGRLIGVRCEANKPRRDLLRIEGESYVRRSR